MELKDKVIAITGGASGLGEASTRHFVSQGAKVMILDINDDNAKAICDELGDENVKYVNTNIMEEEPVKDAMSKIAKAFGKLHVAINCAGTGYGARIIGKDAPHPLDHFKFIIDYIHHIRSSMKHIVCTFEVFFHFVSNQNTRVNPRLCITFLNRI